MYREDGKTVGFKLDPETDRHFGGGPHEESKISLHSKSSMGGLAPDKQLKWYEKVADFDISSHANIIAFAV